MSERALDSASGLRPASAFVLITGVLAAAGASAARLCLFGLGEQPDRTRSDEAPWPEYELTDRAGRTLAVSVECFDVSVSPRALWRAHTPWRIAESLAEVLGRDPFQVLCKLLPDGVAEGGGWMVPARPCLLDLDVEAAARVEAWLDGHEAGRPAGVQVEPRGAEAPGRYTLSWAPTLLLAETERERHGGEDLLHRPDRWTGRLLAGLASALDLEDEHRRVRLDRLPEALRRDLEPLDPAGQRGKLRDALWAELMPTTFRVVTRAVDPVLASELRAALAEEKVTPWQVQLRPRLERRHPRRPNGLADNPMGEPTDAGDAFAVLGHWGVLGPDDARGRAARERDGLSPHLTWEGWRDPLEARVYELENEARPWSGLELLAGNHVSSPLWREVLVPRPRTYTRALRSVARDRKGAWGDEGVPGYFDSSAEAGPVPRVESTLDAELQQLLHEELALLLERSEPALAMGIVVEVESGDVLAVDSLSPYQLRGFAPTQYRFTPGSTFKAVVMANALDSGVVSPDEPFETFFRAGGIRLQHGRTARRIREAEGAPREDWITASQGLAQSVNAVLVQVGSRIPAPELHMRLARMGYGSRPGAGLGPESAGYLPPLDDGGWSPLYTHASICFGHEVATTLWQHAAGLTTIARGGEYRPLRMVRAIEQGAERWDLPEPEGQRVLSERACRQVLEMMALGAREGTGDRVASPEHLPELFYVGTKTGTTEKEEGVVCAHTEARHREWHQERGDNCSRACYRALRGQHEHRGRTCYTSSICVVGQLRPDGPKVLVLVVADDRRSGERYGADVAGPTAVRVLRSALGLAPEVDPAPRDPRDARPGPEDFEVDELPWLEEGR